MASVHQHPRTKYWVICFRNANGKRVYVSSGEEDKNAAKLIAICLQDVADKYRRKKRKKAYLRQLLNNIAAVVGCETIEEYTIRRWFKFWTSDKEDSQSDGTGKRYTALIRDFLAFLGSKAEDDLSELSSEDIKLFRDKQVAAGLSVASANLLLKTIRGCLNAAVAQDLIRCNRADAITLIPKEDGTKKAFNREQVQLLLETTDDEEWFGLILVGYFIGSRLGDCAGFTHEEVDYPRKALRYKPTKQKRSAIKNEVYIPIHPQLMAYLESRPNKSGPIFPRLSQMRVEGESGLSLTFRALLDKAGISYTSKAPRGEKGRTVHSLGFHSLRKAFNTDLANSSVSQEIRQRLIGHLSREVNDAYTEVELKTFRAAIDTLPPFSVKPPTK